MSDWVLGRQLDVWQTAFEASFLQRGKTLIAAAFSQVRGTRTRWANLQSLLSGGESLWGDRCLQCVRCCRMAVWTLSYEALRPAVSLDV